MYIYIYMILLQAIRDATRDLIPPESLVKGSPPLTFKGQGSRVPLPHPAKEVMFTRRIFQVFLFFRDHQKRGPIFLGG